MDKYIGGINQLVTGNGSIALTIPGKCNLGTCISDESFNLCKNMIQHSYNTSEVIIMMIIGLVLYIWIQKIWVTIIKNKK